MFNHLAFKQVSERSNSFFILGDIGVHGMKELFSQYPNNIMNAGILEQSMVSFAAGLSRMGCIPCVHTIAPFLIERALDQLKIDFGYQNNRGNFVSVGGSYDYSALGCTHHCPADVGILSKIPNFEIFVPGRSDEFEYSFNQSFANDKPSYFRLSEEENTAKIENFDGKPRIIRENGSRALVMAVGPILDRVLEACDNLQLDVGYLTTVTPVCPEFWLAVDYDSIIFVEPLYRGTVESVIREALMPESVGWKTCSIGIPLSFIEGYGSRDDLDRLVGLDTVSIARQVKELVSGI